eukprot:573089-Prymnesium_polylepis.1
MHDAACGRREAGGGMQRVKWGCSAPVDVRGERRAVFGSHVRWGTGHLIRGCAILGVCAILGRDTGHRRRPAPPPRSLWTRAAAEGGGRGARQ